MGSMQLPVDPEYFTACIQGAAAAGFTFLGQAIVDSDRHTLRRNVMINGTNVPVFAFLRVTTLFFTLPGKAFLLCAAFKEEIEHDYQQAHAGERVKKPRSPFWEFHIFLGAHPGKCCLDHSGWVFLPRSFVAGSLNPHIQDDPNKYPENCSFGSSGPADEDAEVRDGVHEVLLGCFPEEPTTELFARAVMNTKRELLPHIRSGKLGRKTGQTHVFGLSPWLEFRGCEDSFWAQFSPGLLDDVFNGPLLRRSDDSQRHDQICS